MNENKFFRIMLLASIVLVILINLLGIIPGYYGAIVVIIFLIIFIRHFMPKYAKKK